MNELDEVRTLRSAQPGPDLATTMRMRKRLADRMSAPTPRVRKSRTRRGFAVAVGALAAGAAAVVTIGLLPATDDAPLVGADPASAAEVLREAAANAESVPWTPPRADQTVYVRTHGKSTGGGQTDSGRSWLILFEGITEGWRPVAAAYPLHHKTVDGLSRTAFTPADRAAAEEAGVDLDAPPERSSETIGNGGPRQTPLDPSYVKSPYSNPTPATLATLSTDPDTLLAQVRKEAGDAGRSRDGEAFVVITDLFREADALLPPALRAALFEALGKIPGTKRVPGQANLDGRTGIALSRIEGAIRTDLIVDPATSSVIGEREVIVGKDVDYAGVPIGSVIGYSATRSVIVNKVGDTK